MHQSLLKNSSDFVKAGCPALRFIRSCSSSLPPIVLERLEIAFKAPVLEAYAMTEACHQMTSNPLPKFGPRKPGSVGRGMNVDVIVVGESLDKLPAGAIGEVCAKGLNVTKGYHNRPEANATAFTPDGYLRTGDQGYFDEDGYLFLTGRLKEQINRGGEKIAPIAIDNVLLSCPGIASLFAFGVPHAELGEAVAVVVVLQPGSSVSLRQLNRHGFESGFLSLQWLPECIVYADTVPKGPTGKVQRVKLAAALGVPTLSALDTPACFRLTEGNLARISDPNPSVQLDVDSSLLAQVADAVGSLLALELTADSTHALGMDSFSAVRLSAELQRRFGVNLPAKSLLGGCTLRRLYDLVVAAKVPVEAKLAEAIGAVLGVDLAGLGDRAIPLDSFGAVRVANQIQQQFGCRVPTKELVAGVTLQQLHALMLAGVDGGTSSSVDWEKETTLPADLTELFDRAASALASGQAAESGRSVLLTGATGFLGSHILRRLLDHGAPRVICVVRAITAVEAKARVETKMREQLIWDPAFAQRIVAVVGDVSETNFGLDVSSLADVSAIIHNAAMVNHAETYSELRAHNVASTISAMQLAANIMCRTACPCTVAYVSSAAVCGRRTFRDAAEPLRIELAQLPQASGYVQVVPTFRRIRAIESFRIRVTHLCLVLFRASGLPNAS